MDDASQNYGHLATGTLTNKGQFFGYKDTTHEVKVFYIEKWWGNRWDRINGLLMVGGEILAKMTPPYNLTGKDFEKVGMKSLRDRVVIVEQSLKSYHKRLDGEQHSDR